MLCSLVFTTVDSDFPKAKRVRRHNTLIYSDGSLPSQQTHSKSAPTDSTLSTTPTTMTPLKQTNGRYSQSDCIFLEDLFDKNGVCEASFEFTVDWANDTVYPEFYQNLSSTRKSNSVFADFSGWVYMRLQDFIARQSSYHEEEQEDNLTDDGMQTRLHSSSRPSGTDHSDIESKASS